MSVNRILSMSAMTTMTSISASRCLRVLVRTMGQHLRLSTMVRFRYRNMEHVNLMGGHASQFGAHQTEVSFINTKNR